MELKLSQSPLSTSSSSFSPKHFSLLAQRWKFNIQRVYWKGQEITSKRVLVHVVKEGETLSSISKLYGVAVPEISDANKEIVDVDLVVEGHQLNIPSVNYGYVHLFHSMGVKLLEYRLPKPTLSSAFHTTQWNQLFTVPSSRHLHLAKTTASFLVLVPLLAFCIRCIIGALWSRFAANLRHEAANKSKVHHHGSNGTRWRTALSDLRDPDTQEAESESNNDHLAEDHEQLRFEDISQDYTKLEDDYSKFLSECGMSNSGYWHGGSPE